MTKTERRDPKSTAGLVNDQYLSPALAERKIPETVPVAARISKELHEEIQQVSKDLFVSPSRLMAYGLGYFMERLKVDPSILKFETKRELPRR